MWLGSSKDNDMVGFGLKWVSEIKILGVYFCNSCSASSVKTNWESRIKTVKNIIQTWEKRNLSILGKVCVIKSFLVSQFIYIMKAICVPPQILTEINTLLFRFLWRKQNCNKKAFEKVKRCVLINDCSKGGINMVDIRLLQESFQCEWLQQLSVASDQCKWSWIPRCHFSVFGRDFAFLKSTVGSKQFKGLDDVQSEFWKNTLKIWLSHNLKHTFTDIKTQYLWNNENIKYQGKILYFKEWSKKGITYVNDMLFNNTILLFQQVENLLGPSPALYLQYLVVHAAVSSFLKLNQHNVFDEFVENSTVLFNDEKYTKAKQFRLYMTESVFNTPCCERFWQNKFEVSLDLNYWNLPKHTTTESRLIELQWKIFHNIYPTNILLFKMGIATSNKCPYCPNDVDFIEHFFFYCSKIKPVWKCVQDAFYGKFDKTIKLSKTDALLGIVENRNLSCSMVKYLNHLILIAKMSISKYRYGTPTVIQSIFEYNVALRNL